MNRRLNHLVYRWLRSMKIPVSKAFLKQQLLSHPEYLSLASITDTLDELGIENGAFVIDKEKLNEIDAPFIAHTATGSGKFELISDTKKFLKNNPGFEKRWDGVALVAEKPERFENSENEQMLKQEKKKLQVLWFFILLIAALSLFSVTNNFSWQYGGLLLTTIEGLLVALLIIHLELGDSNDFTEHFRAAGKNTCSNA